MNKEFQGRATAAGAYTASCIHAGKRIIACSRGTASRGTSSEP